MRQILILSAIALMGVASTAVAKDGQRADRMFQKIDRNGDGRIDASESERFRDARFARMDENGDGAVTLEEMRAAARKRRADRIGKIFERADGNGDGVLQRAEFEDVGARRFEMMDANGDGAVTLEEIRSMKDRRGG